MIYLVTFGFEGLGQGWSETHAVTATSEDPRSLTPSATLVAQKRVTFLGKEFAINMIRIAAYSNDGATARVKGHAPPLLQRFVNPVQSELMSAEPSSIALKARCTTAPNLAPALLTNNVTQHFCGAPPDNAIEDGGAVKLGKSSLGVNFTQWANTLIGGNYGWLADLPLRDFQIATVSQSDTGTIIITTKPPAAGGFVPVVGTVYPVRVRRVNNGRSPANGGNQYTYTAANTWESLPVIGLALAQQGGFLKCYQPISPFCRYATIDPVLIVGKRQRGRPFGSIPGRAPNRVRG